MTTVQLSTFLGGQPGKVIGNEADPSYKQQVFQAEQKKASALSKVEDMFKAGVNEVKSGLKGVVTPPEVDGKAVIEAARGGGVGAGIAEAGAQVGKAGAHAVGELGRTLGGAGMMALSPGAGMFEKAAELGRDARKAIVPDSVDAKQRELMDKYPEVVSGLKDAANIGNLALPEVGKKIGKVTERAPGPSMADTLKESVDSMRGIADKYQRKNIDTDVDELLKSTRAIGNKVQQADAMDVNIADTMKDPNIYKGLKVENSKIVPDGAIETIQDRIDRVMNAKNKLMPHVDRVSEPVSKQTILQNAIEDVKGKHLPKDEKAIIERIEAQIEDLPDYMKPSEVDALRAKARESSRDAKGQLKSDSEYAALENGARKTVFDITDDLPIAGASDFKAMNDYVRKMIKTKEFLDKTLRNQVVKGGRARGYAMKLAGAVAGASTGSGPIAAIAGHHIGGVIADIITNNQLGSSMKMHLIYDMTSDPAIIAKAEELLGKVEAWAGPEQTKMPLPESSGNQKTLPFDSGSQRDPLRQDSIISPNTKPTITTTINSIDANDSAIARNVKESINGTPRTPYPNQTPDFQAKENAAYDKVDATYKEMAAQYEADSKKANGGAFIINPDDFKPLVHDEAKFGEYKPTEAQSVHEPASEMANYVKNKVIETVKHDDIVGWTAGGPGNGKGTAMTAALPEFNKESKFVYDSVFGNEAKTTKDIKAVIEKGGVNKIPYIFTTIENGWDNIMHRAMSKGRTVALGVYLEGMEKAWKNIISKHAEFENERGVEIVPIDNRVHGADAVVSDMDTVKALDYTNLVERYAEKLAKVAHEAHAAGKISDEVLKGLLLQN